MKICHAPHLELSPKCFPVEIIALFSASEQTHCALVVCDFEWVTVALHNAFLRSTEDVTMLISCYVAGPI